jgi:hypothetical protein
MLSSIELKGEIENRLMNEQVRVYGPVGILTGDSEAVARGEA